MSDRPTERGLTLVEVLVAMLVLATAVGAILSLISVQTTNASALQEQVLARIVAENVMVDLVTSEIQEDDDNAGGSMVMSGTTFLWSAERTPSEFEGLDILSVRVTNETTERTAAELSTLRLQ